MILAGDHLRVASLGGVVSGGCVLSSGMSSRPSAWCWLR